MWQLNLDNAKLIPIIIFVSLKECVSIGLACCDSWGRKESDTTERLICLIEKFIFKIQPNILSFNSFLEVKISVYLIRMFIWTVSRNKIGEGNGSPLQYSCLENSMNRGALWAAVHGIMKSRTRPSDFTFTFPFHALEKEMATHSSVLAWRIPGTGEPGGLPSLGSHRVGHDWSDLAAAARNKMASNLGLTFSLGLGCILNIVYSPIVY